MYPKYCYFAHLIPQILLFIVFKYDDLLLYIVIDYDSLLNISGSWTVGLINKKS